MNKDMSNQLSAQLAQLEKAIDKIKQTQPFGKKERRLKILVELMKEQNANTHLTARTLR